MECGPKLKWIVKGNMPLTRRRQGFLYYEILLGFH